MLLLNNLYTASGHRGLHNSTMKMKEKLKAWKSGTTACQHECKIHMYMRGLFCFMILVKEGRTLGITSTHKLPPERRTLMDFTEPSSGHALFFKPEDCS